MLRRHDHEGHAEQRIRTGGVDAERFLDAVHREVHEGASGLSDPVLFHGADVFREIDLVQAVQKLVRVLGDPEVPDLLLLLDDIAVADIALAALAVLVGEDHLAVGAVVHQSLVPESQSVVEQLQEDPLGPLVIVFIRGIDHAVPVEGESDLLQLVREMMDVVVRGDTGMLIRLYGIVLSRKAESVEADGEQDIVPLHPALPGDDLQSGICLDMADMHACAAGIGELHQSVELRLRGIVHRVEDLGLQPSGLPLRLDFFKVIIHRFQPAGNYSSPPFTSAALASTSFAWTSPGHCS